MIIKPPHEMSIFSTTLLCESPGDKQISDILVQVDQESFECAGYLRLKKYRKF